MTDSALLNSSSSASSEPDSDSISATSLKRVEDAPDAFKVNTGALNEAAGFGCLERGALSRSERKCSVTLNLLESFVRGSRLRPPFRALAGPILRSMPPPTFKFTPPSVDLNDAEVAEDPELASSITSSFTAGFVAGLAIGFTTPGFTSSAVNSHLSRVHASAPLATAASTAIVPKGLALGLELATLLASHRSQFPRVSSRAIDTPPGGRLPTLLTVHTEEP
mmetsp:Transcript_12219/g.28913  ORF Transcript_12219/g.28913 Transcript_12219/m.28913 type:complete len:222 (-) Transcript_12219:503-1168(-)|eukprot:scaffold47733_cov69-Phaeocystis_antarctica.AAC.2